MVGVHSFSFSSISSLAKRNTFPLALLVLLELLFILCAAGPWPFIFFAFVFFLPGFLAARHFFSDKIEQTAFAFPLSIVFMGISIYFISFVYSEPISVVSIAVGFLLTAIICKLIPRPPETESSHLSRKMTILLLLAVGIGFFAYVSFVGTGTLNLSYPAGTTAWDKVIHLEWVRGMAATGQTTLPPALTGGVPRVESTYFTPLSIFPLGLFARYSGMSFWSAHDGYFILSFIFSILGIFILSRRVWDEKVALVASFIAATPLLYYFFTDLAGMYRVGLVVLFTPVLLIVFERFFQRDAHANILLGILLAGFLDIHPLSIILFMVPLFFIARALFLQKMTLVYALPTALIAFAGFIPFWVSSRADYVFSLIFVPFEWMSPLQFDSKTVDLVGPVLRWSTIWTYALFALAGLILFGLHLRKNAESRTHFRVSYIYSTFWIVLLTAGVSNFIFNYAGKWRAAEYFVFFIPLTAYLVWSVAQRVPRLSPNQKLAVAVLFILVMQSPILYKSKSFTTKIDEETWSVLQWVNEHSPPDAKVYSIYGFYQHSHLLTDRAGNYAGSSSIVMDHLHGKPADFPMYCVPGFTRTGLLSISPYECPSSPSRLEDYDFLLADYLATTRDASGIAFIHAELPARGFTLVHTTENIEVYQNTRLMK